MTSGGLVHPVRWRTVGVSYTAEQLISMKCISELVKQPKSEHSLWFNNNWVKVCVVLITSCISAAAMWCMHTHSFAANNFSSDFHTDWFGCYLTSVFSCSCHGFIFVAVAAVVKSSLWYSEKFFIVLLMFCLMFCWNRLCWDFLNVTSVLQVHLLNWCMVLDWIQYLRTY